jgi:hypothetical protein
MEAWLGGGDLPEETQVRAFVENLTIDTLLDLAGPTGRDPLTADRDRRSAAAVRRLE